MKAMKKFSLFGVCILVFAVALCTTFCGCRDRKVVPIAPDSVEALQPAVELNVEHIVSADRQRVYLTYGDSCRWFETSVTYVHYLDEGLGDSIRSVLDVFQYVKEVDHGYDTQVMCYCYTNDGSYEEAVYDGFMVDDEPLNDCELALSAKDAYERVMESNYVKPHSRKMVLRRQVGPVACNPQYIFGDVNVQLYVDAVTGEVTDKNPVFAGLEVAMPLGEWP